MKHSETQAELYKALTLAIGDLSNPPRTANNPFFKSKYAPLNATLDLVRTTLKARGLAMIQCPASDAQGRPGIVTRIIHQSGEWIESESFSLKPMKDDPQGYGGAITYARRYSLEAMLCITGDDDDDANHASTPARPQTAKPAAKSPTAKAAEKAFGGEAKPKHDASPGSTGPAPEWHDKPLGFGKNKDKTWADVERGYLEWVVENVPPDPKYTPDRNTMANGELAYRDGQPAADPPTTTELQDTLSDNDVPF